MTTQGTIKTRGWCFTWNNYPHDFEDYVKDWSSVQYLIAGRETAPDTGTPHLQGYVYFANPRTLKGLKRLHSTIHWEPARTMGPAIEYCKKSDPEPFIIGEEPMQGDRTDLKRCRELVEEGGLQRVAEEMPECIIKYASGMRLLEKLVNDKKQKKTHEARDVRWFWGPPGSGKTKTAFEEGAEVLVSIEGKRFFCGYEGQETVVLDDLRPDQINFTKLLHILDRYPVRVEDKGTSMPWLAKTIWITCIIPPEQFEEQFPTEMKGQLTRRVTSVRYFGSDSMANSDFNL